MDRDLSNLEDLLYKQLCDIGKKNDISPSEVENAKCAAELLLYLDEIQGKTEMNGGYSNTYSNRVNRHSYGYRDGMVVTPFMDRRYSYGDPMGYYEPKITTTGYMNQNHFNDEYSRHSIKDRAIAKLEKMMDEAGSQSEREAVKRLINGVEHTELY